MSWIALGSSLIFLLLLFFTNIRSYTVELIKLEDAMEDDSALDRVNWWAKLSRVLYFMSFSGFALGLVLLLCFCWYNVPNYP